MATTEAALSSNGQRVALAALGLVAFVLVGVLLWSLQPPPQIGADVEVFASVDALFTAVAARDELRLRECERRLHVCREAGQLTPRAADYLGGVIRQARSGQWESAAQRLYDFMKGQRREGGRAAGKPKAEKPRPPGKK